MKLTVYLDMLILVNAIINYLILKMTSFVFRIPTSGKRAVFARFAASAFSPAIFFELDFFAAAALKIFSVCLPALIAFGYKSAGRFAANCGCLMMITALTGGVIYRVFRDSGFVYINNMCFYFSLSPVLLILCVAGVYVAIWIFRAFYRITGRKLYYDFEISFGERSVTVPAFYDTGFRMRDILGGRAVLMCPLEIIEPALGEKERDRINGYYLFGKLPEKGFIPLFYSDLTGGGMFPGVLPESVILNEKGEAGKELDDIIIAVADKNIPEGAVFGQEIYNLIGE